MQRPLAVHPAEDSKHPPLQRVLLADDPHVERRVLVVGSLSCSSSTAFPTNLFSNWWPAA